MKIECGVYTIHSDPQCMWITQKVKSKDKKSKNEYRDDRIAGYSMNAEQLLNSFVDNKCRRSGAKDVKTLLKDIAKRDREVKKLIAAMTKNGFRLD